MLVKLVNTYDLKLYAFCLLVQVQCVEISMEFLNYFDNVVFINLTFVLIATHLLCLVCFGVFLSADKNFDYPILLNAFN